MCKRPKHCCTKPNIELRGPKIVATRCLTSGDVVKKVRPFSFRQLSRKRFCFYPPFVGVQQNSGTQMPVSTAGGEMSNYGQGHLQFWGALFQRKWHYLSHNLNSNCPIVLPLFGVGPRSLLSWRNGCQIFTLGTDNHVPQLDFKIYRKSPVTRLDRTINFLHVRHTCVYTYM